MGRISDEKVQALKDELDEHIPDWEVVYKNDQEDWPTWWLQVFKWFIHVIGLVSSSTEKILMEDFAQATGSYILVPWSEEEFDLHKEHIYSTVRHEYVHMRDMRRFPVLFQLSYLLPPAFITFRAYWEMRGYTATMLVEYEEHGEVSDSTLDWLEDIFTGPKYLWMAVFRVIVRNRLETIRDRIEGEEIEGLYPDLKLLF